MLRSHRAVALLLIAAAAATSAAQKPPSSPSTPAAAESDPWQRLEPGLELGVFRSPRPSTAGDSRVRALRIDPARFSFHLLNASAPGAAGTRTARQWCRERGMTAAINASMYQGDHRTSVSLMRTRGHVNNPRLTKDMTVLAFDPDSGRPELPPVRILDRQCDDYDALAARYGTLVQSIRMLSCTGRNVWQQQPRRWSTAAIGVAGGGRVLFLHARSPYSVHDLIEILRELPLGLARAMYVEGGPEAQLYVESGGRAFEFVGSYETGFNENDDNAAAWPVPNVVAIRRRGGEGGG
jgi:uncharacterized protein YigE (DUF2233 family)